jgi:hypothetical protein
MMNQPVWSMTGDNGDIMSAEAAETRLCAVIADPAITDHAFAELGRVDIGLQVLALVVNPSLRDRVWNTLDDRTKFWFVPYDRPLPCDEATLVRDIVHDVAQLYHEGAT